MPTAAQAGSTDQSPLVKAYRLLNSRKRHLLQTAAVYHQFINRTNLGQLSAETGWTDENGRRCNYDSDEIRALLKSGLLVKKQNKVAVNLEIETVAIQDAVREGKFRDIAKAVQSFPSQGYDYGINRDRHEEIRDVRIVFYSGDINEFDLAERRVYSHYEQPQLCDPFERDVFDMLEWKMQSWFLKSAADRAVLLGSGDGLALEAVAPFAASGGDSPDFIDGWISLAMARGDVAELKLIKKTVNREMTEIDGCIAMLHGKYEAALKHFDQALSRVKGNSKKNAVLTRLPGIFHVMLLVRENTPASIKRAKGMINVAKRDFELHYKNAHEMMLGAIEFRETCATTPILYQYNMPGLPFAWLVKSWLWRWFVPNTQTTDSATNLQKGGTDYRRLGLEWMAAEFEGALGHSHFSTAAESKKRHEKWHEQNKTRSLFGLIEPVPEWSLKLVALNNLANGSIAGSNSTAQTGSNERMIWQLSTRGEYVSIQPLIQKRNKSGVWTNGRKVALKRLHRDAGSKSFSFLTDQDRRVCQCLHEEVEHSGWGRYRDVYYFIDSDTALPALVGHPLVFRQGDTTTPIEVSQQQPKLVVTKRDREGLVRLKLDPLPKSHEDELCIVEDTPQKVVFVVFEKQHHRLADVIGTFLDVPNSEADRLVETAQALSPIATLHSEIGGGKSNAVDADERLQLHLFPYQSGLRAEFFMRPFGDVGPFIRPGQGTENVFAHVDGQPRTARRKLKREAEVLRDFIADHPMLQQFEDDDAQFRTAEADESLELMLHLQPAVDDGRVQLHWPRGESFRVAGEASASNFKVAIKKDRDWFAATGTLKVNDELTMDLMELLELLDGSRNRFVKLGNGEFLALTEQLRRQLDDLSSFGNRMKKKLRFPPVRAAALDDLDQAVSLKADKHWTSHVKHMREAGELESVVPSTLQAELRDYQVDGYQWMSRLAHWGVGGCLADDMGLGKTVQALAILLDRSADGPALVVAPTSVTFNWLAEGQRFAPTLNMHQFGTAVDRDAVFQDLGPRDVVITSYGLLYTEAERFQAVEWNTVVLDEAQAIKNTATKRSQAAMGLQANFRLIMTGTPLENHLGELWNLFNFINPGLLGSWESFRTRFALPIEQHNCRDTRRQLKKLIQPFILRRTKSQVLEELPPRTEVTLKVELSKEEAAFYEALRRKALEKLEEAADQDDPQFLKVFAELMRLRRACCHPSMVLPESTIGSSKLALFSETIDELLDNRHKVLVFSQFVDHLSLLRAELDKKKVSYQYLDGSTPLKKRQQRVEAFQSGEGDVFLISLKAGGTGLNLTAADYVIHMDPWWNPAVEDQAADRAHRLGQTRPVTIYRLVTEGTIEEKIVELHKTKRDLADSLLDGTDTSARLSAEELLTLLKEA